MLFRYGLKSKYDIIIKEAADTPHQGRDTPVYIGIDMKRRGGLTPGYIQKICNEIITLFVSKRLLQMCIRDRERPFIEVELEAAVQKAHPVLLHVGLVILFQEPVLPEKTV